MLIALFAFTACKDKIQKTEEKTDYNAYTFSKEIAEVVSSITMGSIKSTDVLKVTFVDNIVEDTELNKEVENKLFELSPNIDGVTYWERPNVLVFKPEKAFPHWQKYEAKLLLSAVTDNFKKKELNNVDFAFDIKGVEITGFDAKLVLKDRKSPKLLLYKGTLSFSEKIDLDVLKKAVTLEKGSSTKVLTWSTTDDGFTFSFVSEDLERVNSTDEYSITVNDDDIPIFEDFVKTFTIQPLSAMKLVSVKKDENGKSPKVRLEFSDDFDPEQKLEGLIRVEPEASFKIQRLGNSLVLDGDFSFGTTYKIIVSSGIRSKWGTETEVQIDEEVTISDIKPQIEFASDGFVLPNTNNFKLQFYTSNLKKVHVEIKKVYENSLAEFVRSEKLSSLSNRRQEFNNAYINRVGVIVYNGTFDIESAKNQWKLNEIDLSKLVEGNTNELYLVRLNFNPGDMMVSPEADEFKYIEEFGQIYKPLLFSDIALTCKKSENYLHIYATKISTAKPLSGVNVTLKSQYETYASATTNSEGMATIHEDYLRYNSYIEANYKGERSVLKFSEMEWNISGFDIGGESVSHKETKAFIYTERGVYRPGDKLNISVIARHGDEGDYPENKPVTMELFNPQGKKVYEYTDKTNSDGFYNFPFQTKESDPTGSWRASFRIGNKYFSHAVKIETVVPYKIKVRMESPVKKILHDHSTYKINLQTNYLFGNPAANLDAEVTVNISSAPKHFEKYSDFVFSNPSKDFREIEQNIFKGSTNENGAVEIENPMPALTDVPSALSMKVSAKVLEKGGRPNNSWMTIPIEPYSHYVGLQPYKYSYVATGNDIEIPVILVDQEGNPIPGKNIRYKIYRNSEHWWWHYGNDGSLRFKSDFNTVLLKEGELVSKTTHSKINFLPIEQGSYFIEVIDESGTGHSAGIFMSAYPYGGAAGSDKNAGMLSLNTDKDKYYTGDVAKIQFPSPKEGVILLTVERRNEILEEKWYYPEKEGEMTIDLPITKEMVPNVYVSISLIQPHKQTMNDRPIRMFGIVCLNVEDKDSKHSFTIETASQFRPEEKCVVDLQTSDYKKSQYTIAIVDEGLLDITQFKTPDPWSYFFQKTNLQIRTYDLFSHIINANKGDVFKTFSIGGDMDYRQSQLGSNGKKKRFKPVCIFNGPLETDENGKARFEFTMPNYVGSVRIMVIGARGNSYARSEKAVPVKSELMILPTLPRVLGPAESFKVPITVFAMKDNLGDVSIKVETEGPVSCKNESVQKLSFSKADEKDCFFDFSIKDEAGEATVTITATAGSYKAVSTTNIMVRPTSPRIYDSKQGTIQKGGTETYNVPKVGITGTNRGKISVSVFPAIDFGKRLEWLIRYPYGCIEQTTSSVFPQLYLKKFIEYPEAYAEKIDERINAGIERLRNFQQFSGGFSYWPYGSGESEWGSLYGGHFLVEAKKLGYHIPTDLYENWLNYTKNQARRNNGELKSRAYRCYILALANEPQQAEMNSLKESQLSSMDNTSKWLLAASYKLAGQVNVADEITRNAKTDVEEYVEFSGTYGSTFRDKAMILDACNILDKDNIADMIVREIGVAISSNEWYSTQTMGYSILALGKYFTKLQGNNANAVISGTITTPSGKQIPFKSNKSFTYTFDEGFGKDFSIQIDQSTTMAKVYTSISWDGVPLHSTAEDYSNNLSLNVTWYDNDGNQISPLSLKQGTTFYGQFHVENISNQDRVDEIALMQILPSGWEIENTRLLDQELPSWTEGMTLGREEYTDIRDDRIIWFFDLWRTHYSSDHNELDFIVKLNAVSIGEFELPSTLTEAMYNGKFKATKAAVTVKVVK